MLHCSESERGTGEKNVLGVVNKRQRWAREEVYSTFATGYERQLLLSCQIYDIGDIGAYGKHHISNVTMFTNSARTVTREDR